jgi:nicotinamide mononucleotide (NMN) deamidase PncC
VSGKRELYRMAATGYSAQQQLQMRDILAKGLQQVDAVSRPEVAAELAEKLSVLDELLSGEVSP